MQGLSYDIVRSDARGTPVWIEAVANLEIAKARVLDLAERFPGSGEASSSPPMPQSAQPDESTSTPIAASGPNKVLLIDDGEAVRDVMRIFLEKKGFQICGEAADGVEAIEKATTLRPDLIIMDLAMPRMNGVEAASILSRIMPSVPIVLLTIYGDFVGSSVAAITGIKAVVSKTDGLDKVAACVHSLLQTGGR